MVFQLFRRNPAASWPVVAPASLEFDVAARALNGVSLGAPLAALEQFGRPASPADAKKFGLFDYHSLGVTIGVENDVVAWFAFRFVDPDAQFQPCRLKVLLSNSATLDASSETTDRAVDAAFGRPERLAARENGDRASGYRFPSLWIEASFDERGRLAVLDVDHNPRAAV